MLLTTENFRQGFLVDDEAIGGVTEMETDDGKRVYSAYVSHYLTGETLAYQECERLADALGFLATIERAWRYEAVGCSSKKKTTSATSCGTSTNSGGGCGTSSCGSCG